jgi:transcriptional regulator
MYIPAANRVEDGDKLAEIIRENSFATLVSVHEGAPFATHLPLLFRPESGEHGTLVGHVARANPRWRHFDGERDVLVIFQGPHAYVSPSWYETSPAVPTWNYVAVHVYGIPRVVEEDGAVAALLHELITHYEAGLPEPWSGELPAEYAEKMRRGVVAFEIAVTRIEGKFKLGQNKPAADTRGVCRALQDSPDPAVRRLAQLTADECGIGQADDR